MKILLLLLCLSFFSCKEHCEECTAKEHITVTDLQGNTTAEYENFKEGFPACDKNQIDSLETSVTTYILQEDDYNFKKVITVSCK